MEPEGQRPKRILFTDLDGTLLEEKSYSFTAALPAVRMLRDLDIPIIFCTSKTFAETVVIQESMEINAPFIVENGGAFYFREGQLGMTGMGVPVPGSWRRIILGAPYPDLVARLVEIRESTGILIRSFSDMSIAEIAAECGLSPDAAGRAKRRESDEPFRIESERPGDMETIVHMAEETGFSITRGGRFHHIFGYSDKGRAVRELCGLIQAGQGPTRSVGIGDSPNDLPMLLAVDLPVVVMRPGGFHDRTLMESVPNALPAPGVGPVGWNDVVMSLLMTEYW